MKLKEVIKHLQDYVDQEQECAYSIWFEEDVEQQTQDRKIFHKGREQPTLTEQEKKDVLDLMYRKHDCNIGMNWEFMDYCIDEVINSRESDN